MATNIYRVHGVPDSTTFGNVGDLYVDLNTNGLYKCVNTDTDGRNHGYIVIYSGEGENTHYVWERIEGSSVEPKEVNFLDYDGSCLYAYTIAEAQALSALPCGPMHDGLVFQGWNAALEDVKSVTHPTNIGPVYCTDDGTTRLYVTLQEGRTSPMLGVCVSGAVTVDWGDGSTPDTLTGTNANTAVWTPNHNYVVPGNYVIRLTVNEGVMGFRGSSNPNEYSYILRQGSASDTRNIAYLNSLKKVEIGDKTGIGPNAFRGCSSLKTVTIPNGFEGIGLHAFAGCHNLRSITIPIGTMQIDSNAFSDCYSLYAISIPTQIGMIMHFAFNNCHSLQYIGMPEFIGFAGTNMFVNCTSLSSVTIPNGVTSIGVSSFAGCSSLSSVTVPNGITSIGSSAFDSCYSMRVYDFTRCTAIPVLQNTNAFTGISDDCEIRVPTSLYDEWVTANGWTTYANYIKAY